MTESERFTFDLSGFLVRPGILTAEQVSEIRGQVIAINKNPTSLPPEHRNVPGGPASLLIDHPAVIGVLEEIIGPEIRLESPGCVVREQGQRHGELHSGGPRQIDPIFGYRTQDGRIHAGMVRVIFELSEIRKGDAATHFLAGSHKASFPVDPSHLSLEPGQRSPFLVSYECPAGSAVFFTENVCHAGPVWERADPRVTILHAYSHLATHWHRLNVPPVVLQSLPREKMAYFREPWIADFSSLERREKGGAGSVHNTAERFIDKTGFDDLIDTSHNAPPGDALVWQDSQTALTAVKPKL